MKLFKTALFGLSLSLVIAGCSKDKDEDPDNDPGTKPKRYHLESIDYIPFNSTASYLYNGDSTIKDIVYSSGVGGYNIVFQYNNRQVNYIKVSSSLYEHRYNYENGRISNTTSTQIGQSNLGNKFVYTYNSNGTVAQLQYYDLNESGEQLVYNSTYEYDPQGFPKKIISVNGNNKVIFTIDSYSDVCDFNEWSFVRISLGELYEFYNYPVLSKLNRLPTKITASLQVGSAPPTVQKIFETDYTIFNERLDKIKSSVIYPNDPNNNSSWEALFNYH